MLAASPTHSIPRNCSTWLILIVVCCVAFIVSACGEGSSGPPSIDSGQSDELDCRDQQCIRSNGRVGWTPQWRRRDHLPNGRYPTSARLVETPRYINGSEIQVRVKGDINQSSDMGLEVDQGIDEPDASMDGPACIPAAETCDGADNDCDDKIDEEFDFMTNAMHCGGCNQSCQPNNATGRCEAGQCAIGQCSVGFVDANAAAGDGCECALQNGGNEACNGVDDDCDGRVDESFNLKLIL